MSYQLVVYLVPLDTLQRIPGSRDNVLLEEIKQTQHEQLNAIDEVVGEWDPDLDPVPSAREALRQIVFAEIDDDGGAWVHIYAYDTICAHIGLRLNNMGFQSPISWSWIEEVDELLETIGFPLRIAELAANGAPVDIPSSEDIPSTGWWSSESFAIALSVLEAFLKDDIEDEMREALDNIHQWLRSCVDSPRHCLIGIYS